ncbi:hypothetical protein B0H66DRAFT_549979 [Apodospora peruviana]|uniref:Uncharacterized protein n=1 Tax=Apodospora peruviana TaxID=516989 RepID=A0AAE0MBW7_9PEZI|nr:hypothetical protein B0H66DRAFT_549979 [Apodospora peruviana]
MSYMSYQLSPTCVSINLSQTRIDISINPGATVLSPAVTTCRDRQIEEVCSCNLPNMPTTATTTTKTPRVVSSSTPKAKTPADGADVKVKARRVSSSTTKPKSSTPVKADKVAAVDHAVKKSSLKPTAEKAVKKASAAPEKVSSSAKKTASSSREKSSSHEKKVRRHHEHRSESAPVKSSSGDHHHHHKTSSSHHHHVSSHAIPKTPAVSSRSAAKKATPAMPLRPATEGANLRPNSITAHTMRAVRKSAALGAGPPKIEPVNPLPAVHVPNPRSRAPGLPARSIPVEQQPQRERPQVYEPAQPRSSKKKSAEEQPAVVSARDMMVSSVGATKDSNSRAPAKKEKKYAPEAHVPTSRFASAVQNTVDSVGRVPGDVVGGAGQAVKGVTDTVGRTAEGALGPGLGKPVRGVTNGVGKTVTGATNGVQTTLGNAAGGVGKTLGDTTGALGKGDALGAVGGLTGGLGQTVGGVGKGLVSRSDLSSPSSSLSRFVCSLF